MSRSPRPKTGTNAAEPCLPEGGQASAPNHEFEVAKKIASLKLNHVNTDRDDMFKAQLTRLFDFGPDGQQTHRPVLFTRGTEAHGILFIEGSGSGKTTTILEALHNFAPLKCNPDTEAPRFLHVTIESPATLRSVGTQILRELGFDHLSSRVTVPEIWDQARHACKVRGITLIWLDEAQDLFSSGSHKGDRDVISPETDRIFKMLKSLMQGVHPVVLVMSGTERLGTIAERDPQIYRRFAKIKPRMLSFGADNDLIEGLSESFAGEVGLGVIMDADLTNRILYAGRFRFGRCLDLIIEAIRCALRSKDTKLTIEHFMSAYQADENCDLAENIFAVEDWKEIKLDDDPVLRAMTEQMVTANAKQTRKSRKGGKGGD